MEKNGGLGFKPSNVNVTVYEPFFAEDYSRKDLKITADELRIIIAKTLKCKAI
jgi:hypothetical protein